MAHTIKCGSTACHCMLENDPGTPEFCSDACGNSSSDEAESCSCGHEECGKLRELGSGPKPTNPS
ncbi:MAG: hypothetical protein GIX00_01840 [Candidatus Eremiobacteraeota bacterium]|nr:hypothetical protein [Candidatus Eremiobacteraeota bacterium]MBC5807316.1 hypothetical protein [Candidatus Eremiobacteraeota bacterium]